MAEVQEVGPTLAQNFTDDQWISANVDHAGIVSDYTGNAFSLSLPSGSDTAQLGPGLAQVGGYGYRVPSATVQDVVIPASTNAAVGRTDLIVLRFQASWLGILPGAVRVTVISGVEGSGSRPNPDTTFGVDDTVVDLPLYAITRVQGDTLDQAAVTDLRIWKGQTLRVPAGSPLYAAPLASRLARDGSIYRRGLVSGTASWLLESSPPQVLTSLNATASPGTGWARQPACRIVRNGDQRWMIFVAKRGGANITGGRAGSIPDSLMASLHSIDDPPSEVPCSVRVRNLAGSTFAAGAHISGAGNIYLNSIPEGITIGNAGADDTVVATASWWVS